MAAVAGTDAASATLAGTAIDTVTLTTQAGAVDVLNRSGAADLFVSVSSTDATQIPTDPTSVSPSSGFYTVSQNGPRATRIALVGGSRSAGRAVIIKILGNGNAYTVQNSW